MDRDGAEPKGPVDTGYVAYLIFFLMGAGTLLPWNIFINAAPYFKVRFEGTNFSDNFESFFGIGFNITNVLGLWLLTKHQHRVPPRTRVIMPFLVNSAIFILTTILCVVSPSHLGGNALFIITMFSCLIMGGQAALLQGGIFGLAAKFPAMYTQAVMGGQGMAGMVASLANIITTAAGAPQPSGTSQTYDDVKWSNFAYFLIASLFVVACVFGYQCLERLPFALHYAYDTLTPRTARRFSSASQSLLSEAEDAKDRLESDTGADEQATTPQDIEFVRHRIKPMMWGVFNIFFVTLAIFPAITANISSTTQSTSSRFFNDLFVPFSFLMFNLNDFIGRSLAGCCSAWLSRAQSGQKALVASAWVRWIFFPLFMLCNVDKSKLPVIFSSDAFPILFMIIFALSNGYISSIMMMTAPTLVPPKFQELAGTYMVFMLLCGLGLGSLASFGVHAIVCQCNPFSG